MMGKIAVIVPIYNVESYIHRCIDSILHQTYSNLELILVDDGSPDKCGVICDEYAAKDSRIHVIHQENGGLSAARNAGINWVFANSDSQWITFIDSDDWIHPEMLERLLNAALENDVLVSVCGYAQTGGEDPAVEPEMLMPQLCGVEEFHLKNFVNAIVAWGKLYRRECFEKIRYPVGKIHEDEYVTYRVLFAFSHLVYVPAPLYAYFVNPKGITKGKQSIKRYDIIQVYDEQITFFAKGGYEDILRMRMPIYLCDGFSLLKWIEDSGDKSKYIAQKRDIEKKLFAWSQMAWDNNLIDLWETYHVMWRFHPVKVIAYRAKLIIGKRIRRLKDAFN